MGTLQNKRVLLGITGGIAAYKAPDIVRRLRDAGAAVHCVLTSAAKEFVTPLSLHTVSGRPVAHSLMPDAANAVDAPMEHIDLARWADVILVAPASADFLARLAQGRADDLLSAVCLASSAPLAVAPAMNQQMWANPATQSNIVTLRRRGVRILGPGQGEQACGEVGPGRMLEPVELAAGLAEVFETGELDGRVAVVTAGPTWEAMDPVRGITNRSSGKMGFAIAQALSSAGARVILVSGPTRLPDPDRVQTIHVTSALEMLDAVHQYIHNADVFVAAAAVADYRPAQSHPNKVKKSADRITVELIKNPDILASVSSLPSPPFTVGFAAETERLEEHARAKLESKRVDLVCANLVGTSEGGFESDENRLLLIDRAGTMEIPTASKAQVARALVKEIARRLQSGAQPLRQPA